MPSININQPITTDENTSEYVPLESDTYRVKCVGARVAPSKFADDTTGEYREELTLVWELVEPVTHPDEPTKKYSDRLYQHMSTFWGNTKAGTPSKYTAFFQQLAAENLLKDECWIAGAGEADNQGDLINLERRVLVQKYQKTMGPNAGQWGNKIVDVLPLKRPTEARPVPSRPAPAPPDAETGIYTEAEIRAMNADELLPIVKAMADDAGGRFKKRPYDTMNHAGLVKQALELQTELDPMTDVF